MEVCAEAKRVMVQALSKMYSSRTQRGGIPLHRSLLLTLVMRAARDAYHSARVPDHGTGPAGQNDSTGSAGLHTHTEEMMDTAESGDRTVQKENTGDKENCSTTVQHSHSRKRRGKSATEPDFLPCKKARLDPAEIRRVLQDSTARSNSGNCARETEPLSSTHIPRTIVTF